MNHQGDDPTADQKNEQGNREEKSRLMQQNKGAVSPRRSQLHFLHHPLILPPACSYHSISLFFSTDNFHNMVQRFERDTGALTRVGHAVGRDRLVTGQLTTSKCSWMTKSGSICFCFMCFICVLSVLWAAPRGAVDKPCV